MSRVTGFRGVFVVNWSQVVLGDEPGLAPEEMTTGMTWRWHGEATKLDPGPVALWLESAQPARENRTAARRRAGRLSGLADARAERGPGVAPAEAEALALWPSSDMPHDSFSLTDGCRVYHARLIRSAGPGTGAAEGGKVLAAFSPFLPPEGRELWVCAWQPPPARSVRRGGVICFLPGTRIETPRGPRPIETLVPGDRVQTRDNGVQPVMWRGETQLSGAELFLYPHLRPVRMSACAFEDGSPATDLVVSPGHRVLLHDAQALFNTPEVLVAAADLENGRTVRRDFTLASVTYVHLMFPGHQIITANGVACESFHPALAEPAVLNWHARSIERACPGLLADPRRLGPEARRCLSTPEAQILRHARAC